MSQQSRAQELSRNEIRAKKKYYGKCMEWFGTPICRDFQVLFGIWKINKQNLAQIAIAVSFALNLPLDRAEKRNRKFLNGWFNSQYDVIGPILRQMAIVKPNGEVSGPMRNSFLQYQAENPNSPFVIGGH
jgi:hypothetical protein